MNKKWETFNGKPFSRLSRNEVRVTLGPRRTIYLNGRAHEALGRPGAVELLYDGNRRVIGIKPTDMRRSNAFPVRNQTGHYRHISAAAFCQHFRIRPTATMLFQNVEIDDQGVMELDLTNTVTVTRGAR
jgi:hypothetical protein